MLPRSATVRDLDRLTARVFDSPTRNCGARLDAYRIDDTFYVDIDLPGVDPAGIEVSVDRNLLTVRAERKRSEPDHSEPTHSEPRRSEPKHSESKHSDQEGLRLLVAERPVGTVARQVFLAGGLEIDELEARYEDGVLTLSIPVSEKAEPRSFEVAGADRSLAA